MTGEEVRQTYYARVKKNKKKGYVRIETTLGGLNIELHADLTPMACDNFLRHCESGYYKDTIFHRCIPSFMIQGGDPTGTGEGGESAFEDGKPFRDEMVSKLLHQGQGVVSMANSGKNTNKSQFFITFKSCEHLNYKHTVFGRVVGGVDVLRAMEALDTDKNDKPLVPPRIVETHVFSNPFTEAKEQLQKEEEDKLNPAEEDPNAAWFSNRAALDAMASHPKRESDEIGKYVAGSAAAAPKAAAKAKPGAAPSKAAPSSAPAGRGQLPTTIAEKGDIEEEYAAVPVKKKAIRTQLDFSGW
mmetsp:Transcript_26530/g.76095  ORF Transcript_26530/g.76095 Transcript_26530/m.76095 type:complete len:300 (+) Transcript_26530:627-1526(+)